QIRPGKVAEIRWIGGRRPCSSKDIGIGHAQPKRRPATRGVPRDKAPLRPRHHSVVLFQIRDELFGQRRAPGAIIDRVGKLMSSCGTALIQKHENHRRYAALIQQRRELRSNASFNALLIAAKTVRPVHGGIPNSSFCVIRRQHHHAAHMDRPTPKSGECWTDEVEPLSIWRKTDRWRWSDAVSEG